MALRGFFIPREVLESPMISYVGYSGYGDVSKLVIPKELVDHNGGHEHINYIKSSTNTVNKTQVIVAFTMKNVN